MAARRSLPEEAPVILQVDHAMAQHAGRNSAQMGTARAYSAIFGGARRRNDILLVALILNLCEGKRQLLEKYRW